MNNLAHAGLLTVFPVAASATGALTAVWRRPSGTVMSAVQHLAAGVVIAALVGEILPDLRTEGRWTWAIGGFVLGVGVVLALAAWGRRLDARSGAGASDGSGVFEGSGPPLGVPVGMIVAVAIDLLIDGALVGLGATLGSTQAIILTAALTVEILFLALSVQGELTEAGMSAWRAAGTSAGLGLMTAVGAIGSAAALNGAGSGPVAAVLAFGAAALLYLAVEELLVEAHQEEESTVLTAMFFAGFLIIYGLAQLGA